MPSTGKNGCTGTTKHGKPCNAHPLKGTTLCWRCTDASDTHRARPEDWDRGEFLRLFAELGMVTAACDELNVARSTVYLERQRNEDFAVAWADVEERVTEKMEREAYRRAVEGIPDYAASAGEFRDVTRYSDGLLQFLLKARRPEKYRERVDVNANHTGAVEQRVKVDLAKLSDEQLAQLEEITSALEA